MLRLVTNSLIPNITRRSKPAIISSCLHKRDFSKTRRTLSTMEQPIEKAENGTPSRDLPSDMSESKVEGSPLPKLTAQEYRVYDSMADHMNLFVSTAMIDSYTQRLLIVNSTRTSAKPGTSSTAPARPASDRQECQSALS